MAIHGSEMIRSVFETVSLVGSPSLAQEDRIGAELQTDVNPTFEARLLIETRSKHKVTQKLTKT